MAETERLLRQPTGYSSISGSINGESLDDSESLLRRPRYHSRQNHSIQAAVQGEDDYGTKTIIIESVGPPQQRSIVTVFTLWNTMMGTSLLTMPWAIKEAGLFCGIACLVVIAMIMFYTSYRVIKSLDFISASRDEVEFSDVCRRFLGRWSEVVALFSSLLTLLGGMLVYWILMANFLHRNGLFIYIHIFHLEGNITSNMTGNPICPATSSPISNHTNASAAVQCAYLPPHPVLHMAGEARLADPDDPTDLPNSEFLAVWNHDFTAPLLLLAPMILLLIPRNTIFFTRINSLAVLSVTYMLSFVTVKAVQWKFNVQVTDSHKANYAPPFKTTFPALTGVGALAYFVQNSICTICRNNNPKNNVRDLGLGYLLVCFTYTFIGVIFYVTWPLDKTCIADNLLNNIGSNDILGFVARCALLLQMILVFPLLGHVSRVQTFKFFFGKEYPGFVHKWVMNLVMLGLCALVAIVYPHVGTVIGFVGSACGVFYTIILPCLVHIFVRREFGNLSYLDIIFNGALIILGILNFVGQFLIMGKT